MKLNKLLLILVLTVVFAGAAFFLSNKETQQTTDDEAGKVYLSNLVQRINDVNEVDIIQKNMQSHLEKISGQWVLKEKNNYPADFSKIKKLLLDLNNLKTVEAKTARPEKYGELGVQGVDKPGEAKSSRVDLLDKSGNKIDSIIIGKTRSGPRGGTPGLYVRKSSDAKSWLVSGSVSLPFSYEDLLDRKIIDIKSDNIKKMSFSHADKAYLVMEKQTEKDKTFKIDNLPHSKVAKPASTLNRIATALQNLTLRDVQTKTGFAVDDKKVSKAQYETFDGLVVNITVVEKNKKYYLLLDVKSTNAKSKDKAAKLEDHLSNWVYEVEDFKAKAFEPQLKDLVEDQKKVEPKRKADNKLNHSTKVEEKKK